MGVPRAGHILVLCIVALLTLGVVMVNSADMRVLTEAEGGSSLTLPDLLRDVALSRETLYMALALAAFTFAALLPVRRLAARVGMGGRDAVIALGVATVFLAVVLSTVYWPGLDHPVNHSHRWIDLRLVGFRSLTAQPSEVAKWGLIFVLAWYCTVRAPLMGRFWAGLFPALAASGVVAAIVVKEDLGTGALIGAVACTVMLAGGARPGQFAAFIPLGVAGVVGAIATSDYRVRRITAFLDPYADPQWTGYHMIQSMAAVAGGEGFGRGLGNGLQKFDYLPEDRTDFLFAIICEELGIAGAALVIAMYAALLWSGREIIRREAEPLLKLIGVGVIATVGLQAVINLVVVTGLGPTKGIALPLISAGGTGWILTAGALGILYAMDRAQARDELAAAPACPVGAEAPA